MQHRGCGLCLLYSHPTRTHAPQRCCHGNHKQAHGQVGGDNQLPGEHGVQGAVKLIASTKAMTDPISIFVKERMAKGNVNITTIMGKQIKCKERMMTYLTL